MSEEPNEPLFKRRKSDHDLGSPREEETGHRPMSEPVPEGEVTGLPSIQEPASVPERPFYRRCPLTLVFTVALVIIYAMTSYPLGFMASTPEAVIAWGFFPPVVATGEWWRFITATLLHGSLGHLFSNVVGILIFGNLLEGLLGFRKLLTLYVMSVLGGLGLSYFFLPDKLTIGASTIGFGLIGCYLTLILLMRYQEDRRVFLQEFRSALLFVLIFVIWNSLESVSINVWGHVGGLMAGIIFALLFWNSRKHLLQDNPGSTKA